MQSRAESAFLRQFGYQTPPQNQQSTTEQAPDNSGSRKKVRKEKKGPNRKNCCHCDCPDCGDPENAKEKTDTDEEDEKSTIGDELLQDYFEEDQTRLPMETDRAIKMKTIRSTRVGCPKCDTHLCVHVDRNGMQKEDEEDTIDEEDSLYEIKDAYEDMSWRAP